MDLKQINCKPKAKSFLHYHQEIRPFCLLMACCIKQKADINNDDDDDNIPGEYGHGLLDVDTDAGVPSLTTVVQEVVTSKHLFTTSTVSISEI